MKHYLNIETAPTFIKQGAYLFVLIFIVPVVILLGLIGIITKTALVEIKDCIFDYLENSNE